MRILFVHPPFHLIPYEERYKILRTRPPLELALGAAILRDQGHDVSIIDAVALDLEYADLEQRIAAAKADIAVITTSSYERWGSPYFSIQPAVRAAEMAKAAGAKVVFVGPHGSLRPDYVFSRAGRSVDVVIKGEVEGTLPALLAAGMDPTKVQHTAYLQGDLVVNNGGNGYIDDLDALPMPAYDLLPMDRYQVLDFPQPSTIMLSSRGCRYQCTYCLMEVYGRNWRKVSPKKVVDEMELLATKYGMKAVYFQDEEFMIDRDHASAVCDEIIRRGLKIPWACQGRVNDITPELAKRMKEAGCVRIKYGVESYNQSILNNVKKGTTLPMIDNAIKVTRDAGIDFWLYLVVALPGETLETLDNTARLIARYDAYEKASPGVALVNMGSQLYHQAVDQGLVKEDTYEEMRRLSGRVGTDIMAHFGYDEKRLYRYFATRVWRFQYGALWPLHPAWLRRYFRAAYLDPRRALRAFKKPAPEPEALDVPLASLGSCDHIWDKVANKDSDWKLFRCVRCGKLMKSGRARMEELSAMDRLRLASAEPAATSPASAKR